jgi:hypothetical protein
MVSEVDVERFDLEQPDSHMGSASMVIQPRHGDWVRYEDFAALSARLAEVEAERDEADRRAGAAERGWEHDRDRLMTFNRVRDQMKDQRGFHRNVTFDKVWADVCAKADRAKAAEAKLAQAVEALRHAKANMPHPDQMIDDTLAQIGGDT